MEVPAFAWPPKFLNQMCGAFVYFDGTGAVLAKSPKVESVTRTGAGRYDIVLSEAMAGCPFYVAQTSGRMITVGATDAPVFKNWTASTDDKDGNAADSYVGIWFTKIPGSWYPV